MMNILKTFSFRSEQIEKIAFRNPGKIKISTIRCSVSIVSMTHRILPAGGLYLMNITLISLIFRVDMQQARASLNEYQ